MAKKETDWESCASAVFFMLHHEKGLKRPKPEVISKYLAMLLDLGYAVSFVHPLKGGDNNAD
ncbi:MAG: hypothetical protein AB7F23_10155 [Phycisphaerae bacterium]